MKLYQKLLLSVVLLFIGTIAIFMFFPRAASIALSYKKSCKVIRVEPFLKGMIIQGQTTGNPNAANQLNKFSLICDDGFVCRASDTGFASVKEGDYIVFRGYPEFRTLEEFGKCDNAQLIQFIPQKRD